MEYEVRFYYPIKEYKEKVSYLEKLGCLKNNGRIYEKTIQYNPPSSEYDFIQKK